jgi:three-Cys-motif partner protein
MTGHFEGGDLKTAAKLVILEEYLDVYTTIMDANWEGQNWYVDTHAGTGRTVIDDTGVTIDGSAIIALEDYADSFDRFYLYELDPDHFHKLHETISDRLGYEFDVYETPVDDEEFLVARCDDPYIVIMQMDSNEGVTFLADHANGNPHWMTFVDPKGLTARKSTLDTLIQRSNIDILINYQTTGVFRNVAEGASGQGAAARTIGDNDWEDAETRDDFVELFAEKLKENEDLNDVVTKDLVSLNDERVRFDLVFACMHDRAREIMLDIMNQDSLWEKASERVGQAGFGSFT